MKQSIISIGMTACCLSGNGQFLFAADKPSARGTSQYLVYPFG